MTEGRFLTGSTMGHVVRMSATGAFGITFVFLVDAANLFWLSQIGQPKLVAAIGFAYAIQFFSVSVGVGLMIAVTALVSRSIGHGQRQLARKYAGAGIAISVIVQCIVGLIILIFSEQLIQLAGAKGETASVAARYLRLTIMSLIPMAVGLACSATLRAEGLGAKAMYVTLIPGILLMIIDPILILGLGWGLDGAAVGLVLFRFALAGVGLFFAVHQHKLVAMPTVDGIHKTVKHYFRIAAPAIMTQLATPAGNYFLTRVMAPFGDDAVASWAIIARLTALAFGGIFALSGAIGGIFGQNFGAGQINRLVTTYRDALVFCLIYTLCMWGIFYTKTSYIAASFGLQRDGTDILNAFTSVGVGSYIFIGALFVSNAAFNNLGKPRRSVVLNWLKDGVLSWPLAIWLSASFGGIGIIYGQAIAGIMMGAFAALWGWRYVSALTVADMAITQK